MDYHQLSSSAFADRIKVPRSSISHLLSGRNKPSLDFVMKVVKEFETVELYWLLNGKGNFPNDTTTPSISDPSIIKNPQQQKQVISDKSIDLTDDGKKIERIVIFYSDCSFKEYNNKMPQTS
jgi:transcriptional regulator with XRE-family HTH domain